MARRLHVSVLGAAPRQRNPRVFEMAADGRPQDTARHPCDRSPRRRSAGPRARALGIRGFAAAGLIVALGLAGCGAPSSGLSESGGEVEIQALPAPGLFAAYQVKTVATLSGAGVRTLTESQRSATASQRYTIDVTAVAADSFDVRVASASAPETVTARFARDWTPLRFGTEHEGRFDEADLPTFPVLGEAFQLARDLSGRWRIGEQRPWERIVNFPPLVSILMRGTLTLRRIATRDGRRAAEFEYAAAGEGEYQASRFRMSFSGHCSVDLATGFLLEARTSAPGQFTQSGEPVLVEIREERTLSRPDSRGF